jgi:hypothetical protein
MPKPSPDNRTVAQTVGNVFGGDWKVHDYYDDARRSHVDLLSAKDRPERGVSSFATIGLSDHPIYKDGKPLKKPRVELVGACASTFSKFPNVLATAAFEVINDRQFIAPGIVFPGAVSRYLRNTPMRNILFVPPFLWEGLDTLELPTKTVAWLLAVPISDSELKFAIKEGPAKLEDIFAEKQIDIFDIRRSPVI